MAVPKIEVDISNLDDVRRIVERAQTLHRPVILTSDDVEVAKITPLRPSARRSSRARTREDFDEFMSTLGAWQPGIDVDQLKAELKASRGSRRASVDL